MSKVSHLVLQFATAACLTTLCLGLIVGSPTISANVMIPVANCTACTYSCQDNEKDVTCAKEGETSCTCTCQPISVNDPTGPQGCKVPPA